MRALGFINDTSPRAPICRWRYAGIAVDVVPSEKQVLGFANRWYPLGVQTAQPVRLPSGIEIFALDAPCFCATKLEAFSDRGKNSTGQPDYLGSHDLGDFIAILDGRSTLADEIKRSAPELRNYLAKWARALNSTNAFVQSIDGHLPPDMVSQLRVPQVLRALVAVANLADARFEENTAKP